MYWTTTNIMLFGINLVDYFDINHFDEAMKNFIWLSLFVSLITACAPKVVTSTFSDPTEFQSRAEYEPFVVFEKDTLDRSDTKFLGQIEVKESGFSMVCDFETVKQLAKEQALNIGGNALVITEHKYPDVWSTCHRIKADVLLIPDARAYENEILWHKSRPLEIIDFKGATDKRPFIAATASTFRYRYEGRPAFPNKFKLKVQTFFVCNMSYFKNTDRDSSVLAHEQIHFDISELYSRKFMQRIENEITNLNDMVERNEQIYNEVTSEMMLKQDEYDTEVYADRSKQVNWNKWIEEELTKLEKYADKTLLVKKTK